MQVRLQKIISAAGIASRRAAEQLISDGRVTVNGKTVTELGSKADPDVDHIRVDERRVKGPQHHRYLLLNKPRGYVTTRSDPEKRRTVLDLLKGVREYVYPVGRLDFDSEGLLILTNDGELAATLTHPRHEVERVYEAQVLGVPDAHDIERLSKGIVIEGRRTSPAVVERLRRAPNRRRHLGAANHDPRRALAAGAQDVRRHRSSGANAQARPDWTNRRQESEAGRLPGAHGRGSAAAEGQRDRKAV